MRDEALRLRALWIATSVAAVAGCQTPPPPSFDAGVDFSELPGTLVAYARDCKEALGTINNLKQYRWNCQDGELLGVGDAGPPTDGGVPTCSNPPWLELSNNGDQCISGSRLLALTTDNPDTDVRVVCRRYVRRADNDHAYDDVAVVASNRKTGATCYFQALAGSSKANVAMIDGTSVPSPMADPASSDPVEKTVAAESHDFWIPPSKFDDGIKCGNCHDNDPWMHTPYVDQISSDSPNSVPRLTVGSRQTDTWQDDKIAIAYPYQLVDNNIFTSLGWVPPIAVQTAPVKAADGTVQYSECTVCHRISTSVTRTGNPANGWLLWATAGTNIFRIDRTIQATNWTAFRDSYHYMPIGPVTIGDTSDALWHTHWDNQVKALQCCANHPQYIGCISYPILGVMTGVQAMNGTGPQKCVDSTGQVSLGVMIPMPAVAGRAPGDSNCTAHASVQRCVNVKITHTLVDGTSTTITQDQNGVALGYCVPDNSQRTSDYPVYPGDVVELALDGTTAWDSSNQPLAFQKWTSGVSCPCTDATSTLCRFTTKGATDWFGANPQHPQIAGDPPDFACTPEFAFGGMCANMCVPNGTPCSFSTSCCGQCATSPSPKCCSATGGQACTTADDCCPVPMYTYSSIPCTNNLCCKPPGTGVCWTDADCCGPPGRCNPSHDCYIPIGGACTASSECEDNSGGPNDNQCANGKCCAGFSSSGYCKTDADCCPGIPGTACINVSGATGTGSCCVPAGGPCTQNSDCCFPGFGRACTNGKCCNGPGGACTGNADCCSGVCPPGLFCQ